MTKTEMASRLGISRQQLYRDEARGMPTDSVASAREWRRRNVGPRQDGSYHERKDRLAGAHIVGEVIFPRLIASDLTRAVTGFARSSLGASKPQCVELFCVMAWGLCGGLEEAHELDDLRFLLPAPWDEIGALGAEAWCAKHWPDGDDADKPA